MLCCVLVQVNGSEASAAKESLFSRHPEMADWPTDHNWFFAKMNISQVWVLDYFGGVKKVTEEEYYNASQRCESQHKASLHTNTHLIEPKSLI